MGIITKSWLLLLPESLLHVVVGCQQYLDRLTWRHDSILNFITKSLQPVINVHSSLYAVVNGFLNPSIITGENHRPDLLFLIQSKCLYVLELTVGFESNLNNNVMRKEEKCLNLSSYIMMPWYSLTWYFFPVIIQLFPSFDPKFQWRNLNKEIFVLF